MDAIDQFDLKNKPKGGLGYYSKAAYQSFGIDVQ